MHRCVEQKYFFSGFLGHSSKLFLSLQSVCSSTPPPQCCLTQPQPLPASASSTQHHQLAARSLSPHLLPCLLSLNHHSAPQQHSLSNQHYTSSHRPQQAALSTFHNTVWHDFPAPCREIKSQHQNSSRSALSHPQQHTAHSSRLTLTFSPPQGSRQSALSLSWSLSNPHQHQHQQQTPSRPVQHLSVSVSLRVVTHSSAVSAWLSTIMASV